MAGLVGEKMKNKNLTKKIISYIIGAPASLLMFGEVEDLSLWWVPFISIVALALVLKWNSR